MTIILAAWDPADKEYGYWWFIILYGPCEATWELFVVSSVASWSEPNMLAVCLLPTWKVLLRSIGHAT